MTAGSPPHESRAIQGRVLPGRKGLEAWASAYPYDSLSGEGGGALVGWWVPASAFTYYSFRNGTVYYWPSANRSAEVTVPVSSPIQWGYSTTSWLNITPTELNTTYSVVVQMNYSLKSNPTIVYAATSATYNFIYLLDTSGDGLTDSEKTSGWLVTTTSSVGLVSTRPVQADPSLYATNGLVSDYVEKEFDLDPTRVDSAGSHMLDTWNLTFDLGPVSSASALPSNAEFRYWNENGTYDPFTACLYPSQSPCGATSILQDPSNLTDGGPGDSSVLWSLAALNAFCNLSTVQSAGWLRAVYGTDLYNSRGERRTLTVEGKLSWGANPLSTSTPLNGVADGLRVNPLYSLAIKIGSLTASLTQCQKIKTGVTSYGWAPRIFLNWSTISGPVEIRNYTAGGQDTSTTGTSGCGSVAGYSVVIPLNGTSQYQSLQMQIVLNQSYSPQVLKLQKFNGSSSEINVSYDMVLGGVDRYPASSTYSGTNGTLNFTISEVATGTKANTLIWQPTDNSTISPLPWGVRRWVGEQGFGVIAVYAPSSVTSDSVPYAQNTSRTYHLTLPAGLTNIVLPRGELYSSVFGQGVLENRKVGSYTGTGTAPMIDGTDEAMIDYGSSNVLVNIECYWQNRAVNNNVSGQSIKPICNGTGGLVAETGIARSTNLSATTVEALYASAGNVGGDPSDSAAENSSDSGAAIQVLGRMNISSKSEWDLLLASLLDNLTGGVNGTLSSLQPYQLDSLGLPLPVFDVMANYSYSSGGLFGIPKGNLASYTNPCPGWTGMSWTFCAALSNTPSGVAITSAGLLLASPWIGLGPLQLYLSANAPWLLALGAEAVGATAGLLAAGGQILTSALNAGVSWILGQVSADLSSVVSPIESASGTERADLAAAYYIQNNSTGGAPSPAAASIFASGFAPMFGATSALGSVAVVALGVLVPFSPVLGPVGLILPVLIFAALGVGSHGAMVPSVSGGPPSVKPFLSWLANGTDTLIRGVQNPYYIPPQVGGVAAIASFLIVLAMATSIIAQFGYEGGTSLSAGALGSAIGLAFLAFWLDATTPCNGFNFNIFISFGMLLGLLSLVVDAVAAATVAGELSPLALLMSVVLGGSAVGLGYYEDSQSGC